MTDAPAHLSVEAYAWPEVEEGADLAALVVDHTPLDDGDVVVITSKVVAKAEGLLTDEDRDRVVERETVRVVARRGPTVIAETRHGFILAAAGVDGSNVAEGWSLPLPRDPDGTARRLRDEIAARTGRNVGVVVTDTAGRVWRNGQTDHAIGAAGIDALVDLRGRVDPHGNTLAVTAPAVIDEIASAVDLVKGKTSGRPCGVVRGLAAFVLPPGEHGAGVRALIREGVGDLFGLGAREAVVAAAIRADGGDARHFAALVDGDPNPFAALASSRDDVRAVVAETPASPAAAHGWTIAVLVADTADEPAAWIEVGRLLERADVLAAGHRLVRQPQPAIDPAPPAPTPAGPGWRAVANAHWLIA